MTSTPFYAVMLNRYPRVDEWLRLLGNLGRAPATLDAYARDYLGYCETSGLEAESVTFEQVTLYIQRLLPGQENAVANATLLQRLTAIRLWYDHVVFSDRCQQNSVPRGQQTLSGTTADLRRVYPGSVVWSGQATLPLGNYA